MTTVLEYEDIQGNILRGYKFVRVAHLFGWIDDSNATLWREFLRSIAPQLTCADWGSTKPTSTLNLGLSYQALARLQPSLARELAARFEAFAQGMPLRAAQLGDAGAFPRKRWEDRHVWLSVHADDATVLAARVKALKELAGRLDLAEERPGAALVNEQDGRWYEHFGFRDDISYPAVDGAPFQEQAELAGRGKLEAGAWVPVRTGEFLLGYPDESDQDVLSEASENAQKLLKNATFAILRQLRQHVGAFRRYVEQQSGPQASPSYVASCLMGRTPSGEPLVPVDPALDPEQKLTDFTYQHDKDGARCPLGSHVRRANPRVSGRHRLIRRGRSYGAPFTPGEADEPDRGLWFVGFNANIEDQFEFVQQQWLNGPVGTLSDARDPIASAGPDRSMVIEGDRHVPRAPVLLLDLPSFVSYQGGQYYLYPGLSGLRFLCSEPLAAAARGLHEVP